MLCLVLTEATNTGFKGQARKNIRETPVLHAHLSTLHSILNQLQPLADAAWADAAPRFCYRRFPARAHVFEAGSVVSDLHFLISGLARYYYLHAAGKQFNKSFSVKGGVLSSISSLVTGQPSPFSVQALVACECLTIPYRDLLILSEKHLDWSSLRARLLEMLAIKKERREADFLLLPAQERYEKFLREYADVAHSIPNYHIASYLGITEQGLSRIRRRLKLTQVNASG